VPAIVHIPTGGVGAKRLRGVTIGLGAGGRARPRPGTPHLYPHAFRDEIEEVAQRVYHDVNNGVYKTGFAGKQPAYEQAHDALFARLDWLEERLSTQRSLVGDTITEADIRLWTTLVRFDAVYHNHFKCNRNKLTEMPALWGYARDLFQTPGFGDTIDFGQIKAHYYGVHRQINPTGIEPIGPDPAGWTTGHGRAALGCLAFGDGTPPPPAPRDELPDPGTNPLWSPDA
jgi:putative glutathione S-transferase